MKLRLRKNSVRVRMDRKDVAELLGLGHVLDTIRFGPGVDHTFTYAVVVGVAPAGRPHAHYHAGRLVLTIDSEDAEAWAEGGAVGFDHEQPVNGGTVRVILEKDFACLDRPAGDERDDEWAFSNPTGGCQ